MRSTYQIGATFPLHAAHGLSSDNFMWCLLYFQSGSKILFFFGGTTRTFVPMTSFFLFPKCRMPPFNRLTTSFRPTSVNDLNPSNNALNSPGNSSPLMRLQLSQAPQRFFRSREPPRL